MLQPSVSARRGAAALGTIFVMLGGASDARAQLEITVHGGIDAARLDRPERALDQPARGISLQSAPGEATALGLRLSGPVAPRWGWDAGLVWSRNRSALGTVGPSAPDFETHTIFASATAQALLTPPEARLGLRAGAGPALILHRGSGSSLLTRQADLGGLLNFSAQYSLDGRLGLRVDTQTYLFSSSFRDPYGGQFVGAPVQEAGSQFRHEFVLLAGLLWRTHD
jgi:hypothetical protein